MYDSRERQKFISDAQYVREMQHKMESEYQACLRRQEQNREQTERKREQHARQEQRQKTLSSIYATRSYERPWISGIPATRQTSVDEGSGSSIKSYANRPDSKFPAIEKTSSKQKQKPPMSSSKVTPVAQKQSLLRRKRMNQGGLLGSTDTQNIRKLEDRDRQALLLQAKAQVVSAPDLGVTNETTLTNRKRSQERRNLMQSSKLNLDHKGLNKDSKIGSVLSQAQQSPTWSSAPTLQAAHSSLSNESHSPSLTPTKMAPLRFRGENLYSMLCLNMEDSCEENDSTDDILEKEFLSFNLNHSLTPRGQISKFSGSSLAQDEQCSSVETGDDRSTSARRVESSHQPLRQHNVMDKAMEQSSLRRRNSRDHVKAYTSDGNSSEGADCNKNEIPLFSSRSSQAESRPGSAPVKETLNNISSIDKPSVSVYNRELQAYESNQRRYTDLLTSARSTVHRPLLYSAYNTPRSLIQSAHRAEVPTNLSSTTSQVLDLDGSSRFNVRRPLTPIRSRDSLSATESYETSSPIVSVPEDNSLLEDNIDNGLKSTSPNAPLHDEESLLNSHSSFLSIDSSNPSLFQTNFTAHLHMAGTLHDQLPLALIAVSDLQNPSNAMSNIEAYDTTSTKENKNADPEKLKKLQESLLAEDSEEEGDQCRICQIAGGSLTNPLVEPCGCVGTLQFVHQECLKTWLKAKIKSGAELGAVKTCELCKQGLITDLDDFDVNDYYRNHQQSRAQSELMNSGLYLVLLLHLYEQRFAELMRLNYNQANSDRIQSRGTMDKRVLTRMSSEFGIWQRLLY